jgi:hypothetical protein
MPLFHVQDCDRPGFVFAEDFQKAADLWTEAVAVENETTVDEIGAPLGIARVCEDNELILSHGWFASLESPTKGGESAS